MSEKDILKSIQLLLAYSNGQPAEEVLAKVQKLINDWQVSREKKWGKPNDQL